MQKIEKMHPRGRSLRHSYLYQEDIAQVIDCKLPICMLNNKSILLSDCAMNLLGSYLISNLVTLKKFYDLNLDIIPWPPTNEYFGCECVRGINKLSELEHPVDYIFDIDHEHSPELQNYAMKHKVRYVYVEDMGMQVQLCIENAIAISIPHPFGLLQPKKNVVQSLINSLVSGKGMENAIVDFPNAGFPAIGAQSAVQEILRCGLSDECGNITIFGERINPYRISQVFAGEQLELNKTEELILKTANYLREFKLEEGDHV